MAIASRIAVWTAALAMAACETGSPSAAAAGQRPLTGSWGGAHVSLVLRPDGGALEYDCASGSIDEPLRTDAGGRFTARGTHVPGQGGPEREGEVPPRLPALYSGAVSGAKMRLLVRIPSTGAEIGPLELRRDAEPILLRCL